MTTFDPSQHWTTRDFKTSERLRLQHLLIQRQIKFLLHPSITIESKTIADIGCANGAWLIDTAQAHPSTSLTGYDLSPNLFPPREWTPPNINFKTLDILASHQPSSLAQFDVVNARFLGNIFKNHDPRKFLSNAAAMVKRGGYLQWLDVHDLETMRSYRAREGIKHDAVDRLLLLCKPMFSQGGVDPQYLENWESQYGLQIIHQEDLHVPPELHQGHTEAALHAMYEIGPSMPKEKQGEWYELLAEVDDETARGVGFHFPFWSLVVARKV